MCELGSPRPAGAQPGSGTERPHRFYSQVSSIVQTRGHLSQYSPCIETSEVVRHQRKTEPRSLWGRSKGLVLRVGVILVVIGDDLLKQPAPLSAGAQEQTLTVGAAYLVNNRSCIEALDRDDDREWELSTEALLSRLGFGTDRTGIGSLRLARTWGTSSSILKGV